MGLKKGQTNNRDGRPKGVKNKVTTELKTWVQQLIDNNRDTLEKDLKTLEPKERWAVIEKLMSYTIPKMSSVDARIDFEKLTDEQLNSVIDELTKDVK